jgi:hypothetical protein
MMRMGLGGCVGVIVYWVFNNEEVVGWGFLGVWWARGWWDDDGGFWARDGCGGQGGCIVDDGLGKARVLLLGGPVGGFVAGFEFGLVWVGRWHPFLPLIPGAGLEFRVLWGAMGTWNPGPSIWHSKFPSPPHNPKLKPSSRNRGRHGCQRPTHTPSKPG